MIELNSKGSLRMSFKPSKLAPVKAGIDRKNEIFAESTRLYLISLPAVILIPERLTPGIKDKIWSIPIKIISFLDKSFSRILSVLFLSEK